KLPNKERFDLSRNNRNAKDEKSLYELAIVAEFGPILEKLDLDVLLNELYIFIIQVAVAKNTNKLDKLMNKLSRQKQEWNANNINADFDTQTISNTTKKI
ncbi:6678_t:CDS:2, partial [Scutellospora calospora]